MADPCSDAAPAACQPGGVTGRVLDNFNRRFNAATRQAKFPPQAQTTNGDENLADKCGSFSKCLKQDSPGKVNIPAWTSFRNATMTGNFADFEGMTMGGSRTMNGPMGAYASQFAGAASCLFGGPAVPAPWALASEEYAVELIELYWCSLLRDVPFAQYQTHPLAQSAADNLDTFGGLYKGPRDGNGKVTPAVLFRGDLDGELSGPYISQFLTTRTSLGALQFDQRYVTYAAGVDYMTDLASWYAVQNGVATPFADRPDPMARFLYNGRGLAAYTHVDELYQAYFTAHLVLESINAPLNPTNPYVIGSLPSKKQNGFGTFGGPDIAAVLAQVAKAALNAVWYQKWVVHLRHRPEAGAGLVHLIKNGTTFAASPSNTVMESDAAKRSYDRYGSWLLSQPFPEGSPAHPAYPTGHGSVGGACITVLKFFYDGKYLLENLQEPSDDGLMLKDVSNPPHLTVNGELHKLAHNITFGHGIHGGIHWRSDSDSSIALGEEVAIQFLQDLACTYAEPVNVTFTRLDGTACTITNQ